MNQQSLPEASTVLAMGIIAVVSTLTCCGPLGMVFSLIALAKAKKARRLYQNQPESYTDYSSVKTGRILAYVSLALSLLFLLILVLYFGIIVASFSSVDWDDYFLWDSVWEPEIYFGTLS